VCNVLKHLYKAQTAMACNDMVMVKNELNCAVKLTKQKILQKTIKENINAELNQDLIKENKVLNRRIEDLLKKNWCNF